MAITAGFFLTCVAAVETRGRFGGRATLGLDYFFASRRYLASIFCFSLGKTIGNSGALSRRQKLLANVLWLNTQIWVLEYVLIHREDANGRERLGSTPAFPFARSSPLLRRLMMVPRDAKSRVVREKLGCRCLSVPEGFSAPRLSLNVSEKSVYLKKILFIRLNLSRSWEETFTYSPGQPVSYQTDFSLGFIIFDVILGKFPAGPELSAAGCLQRSRIK